MIPVKTRKLWQFFAPAQQTEELLTCLWHLERTLQTANLNRDAATEYDGFGEFKSEIQKTDPDDEAVWAPDEVIQCLNQCIDELVELVEKANRSYSRDGLKIYVDVRIACIIYLRKLIAGNGDVSEYIEKLKLGKITHIPLAKLLLTSDQSEPNDWLIQKTLELLNPFCYEPFISNCATTELNIDELTRYCIEIDHPRYALTSEEKIQLFIPAFYASVASFKAQSKPELVKNLAPIQTLLDDARIGDMKLKRMIFFLVALLDDNQQNKPNNPQDLFDIIKYVSAPSLEFSCELEIIQRILWVGMALNILKKLEETLDFDHRTLLKKNVEYVEFFLASMTILCPNVHLINEHYFYEVNSHISEAHSILEKLHFRACMLTLRTLFEKRLDIDARILNLQEKYPWAWKAVFENAISMYLVTAQEYKFLEQIEPVHCKAPFFNLLWEKRNSDALASDEMDLTKLAYDYLIAASKLIQFQIPTVVMKVEDVIDFIGAIYNQFSFQKMRENNLREEEWIGRLILTSPPPFKIFDFLLNVRRFAWFLHVMFITDSKCINHDFLQTLAEAMSNISLHDFIRIVWLSVFNLPPEFQLSFVKSLNAKLSANSTANGKENIDALTDIAKMLQNDFANINSAFYFDTIKGLIQNLNITTVEASNLICFLQQMPEETSFHQEKEAIIARAKKYITILFIERDGLNPEESSKLNPSRSEIQEIITEERFMALGGEWDTPFYDRRLIGAFTKICMTYLNEAGGAIDGKALKRTYAYLSQLSKALLQSPSTQSAFMHLIRYFTNLYKDDYVRIVSIGHRINPDNDVYRRIISITLLLQRFQHQFPNEFNNAINTIGDSFKQLLPKKLSSSSFEFFQHLLFAIQGDVSYIFPTGAVATEDYRTSLQIFCQKCADNQINDETCLYLFEVIYFSFRPGAREHYINAMNDQALRVSARQQGLIRQFLKKIQDAAPSLLYKIFENKDGQVSFADIISRIDFFNSNLDQLSKIKAKEKEKVLLTLWLMIKLLVDSLDCAPIPDDLIANYPAEEFTSGIYSENLLYLSKDLFEYRPDFTEGKYDAKNYLKPVFLSVLHKITRLLNVVLPNDLIGWCEQNAAELTNNFKRIIINLASMRLMDFFEHWDEMSKKDPKFEHCLEFLFMEKAEPELKNCVEQINNRLDAFAQDSVKNLRNSEKLLPILQIIYEKLSIALPVIKPVTESLKTIHQQLEGQLERIPKIMKPMQQIIENELDIEQQKLNAKSKNQSGSSKKKSKIKHKNQSGVAVGVSQTSCSTSQLEIEDKAQSYRVNFNATFFFTPELLKDKKIAFSDSMVSVIHGKEKMKNTAYTPFDLISIVIVLISRGYIWCDKTAYNEFLNCVHNLMHTPSDAECTNEVPAELLSEAPLYPQIKENRILQQEQHKNPNLEFKRTCDLWGFFLNEFNKLDTKGQRPEETSELRA